LRKHKFGIAAVLVAVAALVVGLTGLAGALPGKGSIDSNDLKRNSVKAKALKNGAVNANKLGATIVRTGNSPATIDSDGTQNGAAGPVAHAKATATCQGSERLIGGGAKWLSGDINDNRNLYIQESYPDGKTWRADGIVDFGAQGNATLQAIAICLK